MTMNPLLEFRALPPFGEIQAEHMLPAVTQVLEEARAGIESLLAQRPYTYQSLVQGREELEDRLNQVWSPVSHMNSVVNSA